MIPLNIEKYPNCNRGIIYAKNILSGNIPACVYVIGACKRFFNDLQREDIWMDWDRAERYLKIVQQFNHVKGKWPTKNIVYEPWQCFIFMNIEGWKMSDTGHRRFREAHIEVPRGNAKSAMASQSVLFHLCLDEPNGNEISTVATKKDQARIVLDSARNMAKSSKSFLEKTGVKVLEHTIQHKDSNSVARAIGSDSNTSDGLNDVLSVMDELHAMDRTMYDVVKSGMSKRRDSLLLCITTAGFNMESIGYSQSSYAKKVCEGDVKDDQFFSIVYTIDKDDDIYDERTWIKANPNWGVSVDPVTFKAKVLKTIETPADLPNVKVKHLNIWLSEANAYFDVEKWDACADHNLKFEDYHGRPCFAAIDLASKIDIASTVYVFKNELKETIDGTETTVEEYVLFDESYIPENRLNDIKDTSYKEFVDGKWLKTTKGDAINYDVILDDIIAKGKKVRVQQIAFDPWNATKPAQDLEKKKFEMVEFRFNVSNLSEPTKTLDALIRKKRIRHNGSPLLRWCLGNVVCKTDAADNVFPKKNDDRLKIDPIIAGIMAIALWIQDDGKTKHVYKERGVIFL